MHLLRLSAVAAVFESSGKSEILRFAQACPEGEARRNCRKSCHSEGARRLKNLGISATAAGKARSFASLSMTFVGCCAQDDILVRFAQACPEGEARGNRQRSGHSEGAKRLKNLGIGAIAAGKARSFALLPRRRFTAPQGIQ